MNMKYIFSGIVLAVFSACNPVMKLSQAEPQKNQLINGEIAQKKELVSVITPYKKELENKMNQKISHTEVELNRKGDNSSLGQLLADFVLEAANDWGAKNSIPAVNAAILNVGGIRNDISKGDILLRNIFEVMPFENQLVIVKMKGEDIQGVFDYYEKQKRNNPVAGFTIVVENGKLKQGLINGEKPKAGQYYYIATSDYLAYGGDYMKFFLKGEQLILTEMTLRDLFIEKFKQNPEIKIKQEQRLQFIGNNQ